MTDEEPLTEEEIESLASGRWKASVDARLPGRLTVGRIMAAARMIAQRLGPKKMHGNHEATCLCCRHFRLYLGTGDFSDVTPGDDAEFFCSKGHFHFQTDDENIGLFDEHDVTRKAQSCDDYVGRRTTGPLL